jgi:predicted transcriptional regulator/WD40 repeat protein
MRKYLLILGLIAFLAMVQVQPCSASDEELTTISDQSFITYINDISWVPGDEDRAVIVGYDEEAEIWEYDNGVLSQLQVEGVQLTDVEYQGIDWKPDGSYALIVGKVFNQGGVAVKYDGITFTEYSNTDLSYKNYFQTVRWDPTGTFALIGGGFANQGLVYRFNGATFEDITPDLGSYTMCRVNHQCWTPSGDYCLLVGDYAGVYKYQKGNISLVNQQVDNVVPYDSYHGIGWRPDGAYALLVGSRGKIVKFDGNTFTNITSNTQENLMNVAWSPDSDYALLVSEDGSIFRFDGVEVTPIFQEDMGSNINIVSWKPDGSYALIGGSGLLMSYSVPDDPGEEPVIPTNEPETEDPTDSSTGGVVVSTSIYGLIGVVSVTTIIVAAVVGTEIGKYNLYAFTSSLYTKLSRKKLLHHGTRNMIWKYIIANPGDHYNAIRRMLKLNNGTLAYHLKVLEREGFIRSMRDGVRKRFYPVGMRIAPDLRLSFMQQRIIDTITTHPGTTQKDIAIELDVSKQVVNYHINIMVGAGLVRIVKEGNKTMCYDNRSMVTQSTGWDRIQ